MLKAVDTKVRRSDQVRVTVKYFLNIFFNIIPLFILIFQVIAFQDDYLSLVSPYLLFQSHQRYTSTPSEMVALTITGKH
jgi:hypothetical protein